MNAAVNSLCAECLEHTGGDTAAAATLTLAAVMQENRAPVESAAALTVDEAAARLRTHPATIYRLSGKTGLIPAGRSVWYSSTDHASGSVIHAKSRC